MSDRPVVLLSIPSGAAAGNMLRPGHLIPALLAADPSVHIVILSPLVRDPEFVREFARPRVEFDDLPPHRPAGLEARLVACIQAGYLDSKVSESVQIRRAEAAAKQTIRWVRAKRVLASILAPSMVRPESRYALSDRLVSHPVAERLFARHRPVLVVAASPGLTFSEIPLLRTAARRGVRSMALDASWDNFTNKLLPVRRIDRLIVWNELMKRQAVELHGYQPDQIRVAGVAHWDLYFRPGTIGSRDDFFRRIGADATRRLITLTTTPRELYGHHDHVLRILIGARENGRLPADAQILVRLHPRDDLDAYAPFAGIRDVIIEKPFRSTVPSGDGLAIDVTADSQRHLANTMRHSDVIVNVASTIAIEGAVFDTPIVNISFDGAAPEEFAKSARRYYRFTHYQNITRHGAVRVAESGSQLVEDVSRYLADPSLDREGRRKIVAEQCQFTDGRSAERVAQFVVDELADVTGIQPPCVESLASSR
jgi:hypothetical protein